MHNYLGRLKITICKAKMLLTFKLCVFRMRIIIFVFIQEFSFSTLLALQIICASFFTAGSGATYRVIICLRGGL